MKQHIEEIKSDILYSIKSAESNIRSADYNIESQLEFIEEQKRRRAENVEKIYVLHKLLAQLEKEDES